MTMKVKQKITGMIKMKTEEALKMWQRNQYLWATSKNSVQWKKKWMPLIRRKRQQSRTSITWRVKSGTSIEWLLPVFLR